MNNKLSQIVSVVLDYMDALLLDDQKTSVSRLVRNDLSFSNFIHTVTASEFEIALNDASIDSFNRKIISSVASIVLN